MDNVSWDDCQHFLERLNGRLGAGARGYRLPTQQAEWEYACRAGSESWYSYGDDEERLGEYAWYDSNSGYRAHPVGEKKPNAWGLYDMHGNVWEWCADCYARDYYANSPTHDPTGPSMGTHRVARGGSWADYPSVSRSGRCTAFTPDFRRGGFTGFRLARTQ